ncbi:MAG: DUF3575 domain-containing protein [Candidatus Symbiothrix sp.]|jgi:hypothetical protein|nr:DUF3575 domain-containing protein [Candidatus Symbiothrix sp.]
MRIIKKYKAVMLVVFLLLGAGFAQAQEVVTMPNTSPTLAVSTNLLYDATTSMNLGVEFQVQEKWTLKIPVTYNPWEFQDNKKFKLLLVQPELRKWFCEPFTGSFFGVHAHYGIFNVGGVDLFGDDFLPNLKKWRYEGKLYGVGVSYGYDFYLAPRWSLEASIGVGYARIDYDRYDCHECGSKQNTKPESENYFGPTQVGLSLIYIIK